MNYKDINRIKTIVKRIYAEHTESELEDPCFTTFPEKSAYAGQNQAIQTILDSDKSILDSETGTGKSIVFMTAAHESNLPTIVIEPRKFLQDQVATYFDDFVICGKSEYDCFYAESAESAPCIIIYTKKINGEKKQFFRIQLEPETIEKDYPCEICDYIAVKNFAFHVLKANDVLIVNSGNFWTFRKAAKFVIIDEADEFLKMVSSAYQLNNSETDVKVAIWKEVDHIESQINYLRKQKILTEDERKKLNKLINKQDHLMFYFTNSDMCFLYSKKNKYYVELYPQKAHLILERLFPKDTKLCIVSATPPAELEYPRATYSVQKRTGILYTPIGLMTTRNIKKGNEELIRDAAQFIVTIHKLFQSEFFDHRKTVIHAGNIGLHGELLQDAILNIGYAALLHERGKLKETMTKFLESDTEFLIVVAAEHGFDLKSVDLQFVLKVPFAAKDARMKALEQHMGKEDWGAWYARDAMLRLVQQCGRVSRGANSFGITFILDEKFASMYVNNRGWLPKWFMKQMYFW